MKSKFICILKGVLLSLVTATVLACLFAVVVYFSDLPDFVYVSSSFIIGAIACVFGGFYAGKKATARGLFLGGAVGLLFFLVLAFLALMIKKELDLDLGNAIMLASCTLSGMLGGVLGVR